MGKPLLIRKETALALKAGFAKMRAGETCLKGKGYKMPRTIKKEELRANLDGYLEQVEAGDEFVVLGQNGQPVATLNGPGDAVAKQQARRKILELMDQISASANLTEEEAMKIALEADEERRQELLRQRDSSE